MGSGLTHILYSGDIFVAQSHGGVSRYFSMLAGGTLQAGFSTKISAPLHWNHHLQSSVPRRLSSLPTLGRSRGSVGGARLLARAATLSLLHARNRDWVYHPTYYSAVVPPSRTLTVVTVYDMIHELLPTFFSDEGRMAMAKRRWCNRADLILAISETTKRDLLTLLPVDPAKVVVTPLGVHTAHPAPTSVARRPFFLYVGARRGYKNFRLLLTALAQLTGPEVPDLIAFGGPELGSDERRAIAELQIEGRVTWRTGNDALLAAHYRDAIALIVPSLYEGFGLPLLESMIAGCPVVASRTAALEEVGGNGVVYFDPNEAEELAACMSSILSDDVLRERCRTTGSAQAKVFTWKRTVDATIAAYQSLF